MPRTVIDERAHEPDRRPRRRDVLMLGGGLVAGAASVAGGLGITRGIETAPHDGAPATGTGAAAAGAPAAAVAPPLRRFRSVQLTAPQVTVTRLHAGAVGDGVLLATPMTDVQNAVVLDGGGEPIWIDPEGRAATDLRVQRYRGRDVLTFWAGRFASGYGIGVGQVLDDSYRTIATVRAGNGLAADLHEFTLTSAGTALLTAYPVVPADLRAVGGPAQGFVLGCRVQEVDVESGRVLLDWSAPDHLSVDETYEPVLPKGTGSGLGADTPFDPFHVNSVDADGDALLVSARHTHALYSIDRLDGTVRWRLGGRRSDFQLTADAAFAWQHDARRRSGGRISVFDNHRKSGRGESRGLLLRVDETARTVSVVQGFANDRFGFAEGNLQALPNGNVLVGWGKGAAATEFAADGTPLLDVAGLGTDSYRVYRQPWTGSPATDPDVAVTRTAAGVQVHASWNGATRVARWAVQTGPSADALSTVTTLARAGFETTATVRTAAAARVQALDDGGGVLGTSRTLVV